MNGRIPLSSGVFESSTRRLLREDGTAGSLTPKEAAVLLFLVEHQDRAISREELLEKVWGYSAKVYSRTLEVTLHRLRAQIEREPSAPEHIRTMPGAGYQFFPLAGTSVPPARRVELIGREGALVQLKQASARSRVVTLIGIGGIGKTTLATEFIRGEPVAWVDLSEESEVQGAVNRVSRSLGLLGAPGVDEIGAVLASRGSFGLAIDNLEQLVLDITPVLRRWLDAAPDLRLILTSRVALGLREEILFSVEPLAPEDATRLLLERAQRRVANWGEGDAHLGALVRRLSGIPLALELAAARARLLSPAQLLERLESGRELLSSQSTDRPERHHSLRQALEGSWELLSEHAQGCLLELSVFSGGFPLEALEKVSALPEPEALLEELLEHSWVIGGAGGRFELLVPIREFALEKLEPARAGAIREAIGRWVAEVVPDDMYERLHSREGMRALDPLRAEMGNLRVGQSCASVEVAARCTAALLYVDEFERRGDSPAFRLAECELTENTRRLLVLAMIELGNFTTVQSLRRWAQPLKAADRLMVGRAALSGFSGGLDYLELERELSEGIEHASLHEQLLLEMGRIGAFHYFPVRQRLEIGEAAVRQATALGDEWCRWRAASFVKSIRGMWIELPEWDPKESEFTDLYQGALVFQAGDQYFEEWVSKKSFDKFNPAESLALRCRWADLLLQRGDVGRAAAVMGTPSAGRLGAWLWERAVRAQIAHYQGDKSPGDAILTDFYAATTGAWSKVLAIPALVELFRIRRERDQANTVIEELRSILRQTEADSGSAGALLLLRAERRLEAFR